MTWLDADKERPLEGDDILFVTRDGQSDCGIYEETLKYGCKRKKIAQVYLSIYDAFSWDSIAWWMLFPELPNMECEEREK